WFDVGASGNAIMECAAALEGARALVQAADVPPGRQTVPWRSVDTALARAAEYLRSHLTQDSFDRLRFIVSFANRAARAVAEARRALPPGPPLRSLWRQDAADVFQRGAFDVSAFAPVGAPPASEAVITLGRRLFFDPVVSGPRTRSCAFCHEPSRAF